MTDAEMRKDLHEIIIKAKLEMQLRCGNGDGKKPVVHSFNCMCDHLNREIDLANEALSRFK